MTTTCLIGWPWGDFGSVSASFSCNGCSLLPRQSLRARRPPPAEPELARVSKKPSTALLYRVGFCHLLSAHTTGLGADDLLVSGGHLGVATLDGLPDRLVEPPISGVASSRVKFSLQPSSGKHSQPILVPHMGDIQDMYLNDTYKTHIKVGGTLRYSFPLHQLERTTYTTIMMPEPVA